MKAGAGWVAKQLADATVSRLKAAYIACVTRHGQLDVWKCTGVGGRLNQL